MSLRWVWLLFWSRTSSRSLTFSVSGVIRFSSWSKTPERLWKSLIMHTCSRPDSWFSKDQGKRSWRIREFKKRTWVWQDNHEKRSTLLTGIHLQEGCFLELYYLILDFPEDPQCDPKPY